MARTTTTDILVTKLTLDGKEYKAGVTSASGSLDKFSKKQSATLGHLRKNWIAYTAAVTAALVAGRKLVNLAAEQERVERRLSFAVKSSGAEVLSTTRHLKEYASALQQSTGFGDEAIITIQTMMIQLGELSGEKLDRATRLTLDFASAMGIDMKAAGILMAKAATGSTEALSRYGIILDENIPKSEKFNVLLDVMQEKFGGTAAAELDTYSGSMRKLKSNVGDLGETLGKFVIPALTVAARYWSDWAKDVERIIAGLGKLKTGVAEVIIPKETQALVDAAAAVRTQAEAKRKRAEGISAAAPGGQISGLGTFLMAQEAETKALLETQAARIAATVEIESISQAEMIQAQADNYDMQQQMAIDNAQALMAIDNQLRATKAANIRMNIEATRMGFQALATAFPKAKAFAKAEVILSGIQSVQNALAVKPFFPLGLAMAVKAGAMAKANISAIDGAGITGGGGTSSYSFGGASMSVAAQAPAQDRHFQIINAGDMVNREALISMLWDSMGDKASASGGRSGNVTFEFVEN